MKETHNLLSLNCMSLPSHAFHYGMLSHFFVDSKLRENSLMILRKHARISLFPAHCFSKSTPKVPKYGPLLGMLSLFTPGRCLKCMGRGWPLTPWRVGKLNIKQFPGMPRTQTSRIAGNKFSVMSLFPLYGCGRKATT